MTVRHTLLGAAILGLGLLLGAAPADQPADAGQAAHRALMQASEKMNREMTQMQMAGEADVDFANMMIVHHQGAIDMANVELQYGKDPEMRAKAQQVIDEQTKEVDELKRWLKDRKPVQ